MKWKTVKQYDIDKIVASIKKLVPGATVWTRPLKQNGFSINVRTHKVCMRCRAILPLDASHFHHSKNHRDGFSYWCRNCMATHRRTGRPKGRPRKKPTGIN